MPFMEVRMWLRQAHVRCTPAREAVLRLLHNAQHGLAHSQMTTPGSPIAGIDRVTLYRALETLVNAGLVHRVQGLDGIWYFHAHPAASRRCPADHPHFQCTRCGRVRCLTDQELPWVTVADEEQVLGKQLVVHGICSSCAQRGKGPHRAMAGSARSIRSGTPDRGRRSGVARHE